MALPLFLYTASPFGAQTLGKEGEKKREGNMLFSPSVKLVFFHYLL